MPNLEAARYGRWARLRDTSCHRCICGGKGYLIFLIVFASPQFDGFTAAITLFVEKRQHRDGTILSPSDREKTVIEESVPLPILRD